MPEPGTGGPAVACWALRTDVDLDAVNLHLAELEAAGLLGVVEEGGRATVYLPERVDELALAGEWEAVEARDWDAAWRASLQPVTVGALTVVPPWTADGAAAGGGVVVVIEPGQAFGTGHHETTTGCLAALQELDLAGASVLDVGTGSGVLAIAAALLGAERVVAVDTDPLAVDAARVNAERNGVAVDVRSGSLDAVDVTPASGGSFGVVVANLDTSTVVALAAGLVARVAPGGTLVVSGVSLERRGEAVAALEGAGLPVAVRAGREWAVLTGVG